jgi:uncharacterized protein (TIRG00374 family)
LPPTEQTTTSPSARGRSLAKLGLTLLRLALAAAILRYLYRSGLINLRPLAKLFTAWPISLAAVLILLLDVFLMAIRTCWMFRPVGLRLPVAKSFQLNLVASFFSNVIPGAAGGDVARLFYTTQGNKGNRAKVATVVLLDRAVGLFSMLLLPLLFAPFFIGLLRTLPVLRHLLAVDAAVTAALLIAFLLCIHSEPIRRFMTLQPLGWESWRRVAERVLNVLGAYKPHGRTLLASLGIALVANLSVIAVMALSFVVLNPAWLSPKMILVIPMGEIANCMPLTPGGLGVGEAAFHSLFQMAGLHGGVEAVLCWRLWKAVVGLIGLVVYLGGLGRVVFDSPDESQASAPA